MPLFGNLTDLDKAACGCCVPSTILLHYSVSTISTSQPTAHWCTPTPTHWAAVRSQRCDELLFIQMIFFVWTLSVTVSGYSLHVGMDVFKGHTYTTVTRTHARTNVICTRIYLSFDALLRVVRFLGPPFHTC